MDIEKILEALETLSAQELRRVQAHAEALAKHIEATQNPDYQPSTGITHRQEYTKCNKTGCKACTTGQGHGPYWYAYWREDGKLKKKYIGKELHR